MAKTKRGLYDIPKKYYKTEEKLEEAVDEYRKLNYKGSFIDWFYNEVYKKDSK